MTGATPQEDGGDARQLISPRSQPGSLAGLPDSARLADAEPCTDDTIDEPDGSAPAGDWPGVTTGPAATASRSLLAWLWGEQGVAGEYLLGRESVIIGRDPGSDIVLGDPTVSREHARIEHHDGQWWLVPLNTTGRTWINGRRITPGQRHAVRHGDRLRFGFHTQVQMLVPNAR
jgi:hypothetical protein